MLRDTDNLKIPRIFKDIRSALWSHGFSLPLSDEEVDVLVSEGKFSRAQILECADISVSSLDTPTVEDSSVTLQDMIPAPTVEIQLSEEEIESAIDKVLLYMKTKYRDMVEEWMYAVLDGGGVSQAELSKKYNLSQPNVSRVLKSAVHVIDLNKEEIRSLFGLD